MRLDATVVDPVDSLLADLRAEFGEYFTIHLRGEDVVAIELHGVKDTPVAETALRTILGDHAISVSATTEREVIQ